MIRYSAQGDIGIFIIRTRIADNIPDVPALAAGSVNTDHIVSKKSFPRRIFQQQDIAVPEINPVSIAAALFFLSLSDMLFIQKGKRFFH